MMDFWLFLKTKLRTNLDTITFQDVNNNISKHFEVSAVLLPKRWSAGASLMFKIGASDLIINSANSAERVNFDHSNNYLGINYNETWSSFANPGLVQTNKME